MVESVAKLFMMMSPTTTFVGLFDPLYFFISTTPVVVLAEMLAFCFVLYKFRKVIKSVDVIQIFILCYFDD